MVVSSIEKGAAETVWCRVETAASRDAEMREKGAISVDAISE